MSGAKRAGALALAIGLGACAGGDKRPPPLCSAPAPAHPWQPPEERTFPPDAWIRLLVPSYDASGEVLFPVKDCAGAEVPPGIARCARFANDRGQPITPIGAKNLVVAPMRGGEWRIVWVQTERFDDGEVSGPVALARFDGNHLRVEALGALRTGPEKVQLTVGHMAGTTMLAAEGDSCSPSPGDGRCRRTLALVPLSRRQHLAPVPLTAEDGACVGPATIPLRVEGPVPGRPRARFNARSAVTYKADVILVQEELTVTNDDTGAAPGSSLGRMSGERKIAVRGTRLVTNGPALLDDWLVQTEKR